MDCHCRHSNTEISHCQKTNKQRFRTWHASVSIRRALADPVTAHENSGFQQGWSMDHVGLGLVPPPPGTSRTPALSLHGPLHAAASPLILRRSSTNYRIEDRACSTSGGDRGAKNRLPEGCEHSGGSLTRPATAPHEHDGWYVPLRVSTRIHTAPGPAKRPRPPAAVGGARVQEQATTEGTEPDTGFCCHAGILRSFAGRHSSSL